MIWRFSAEGKPIIVSPGKLSAAAAAPNGPSSAMAEDENGCGWREDTFEGMKTRVVFERPARAEPYRCGRIFVERRLRMLEVRVLFTEWRKGEKGEYWALEDGSV